MPYDVVVSKRNDEPEKASRPWDSARDGFIIGEGAGILILEELCKAISLKTQSTSVMAILQQLR